MALKVWLPLNGNLDTKAGNISYSLASGNSWVTTGGKISGKALKLTKLQQLLPNSSLMSGVKEFSFSYWVKVNTAWSTQWLDGIRWISTDGSATATCRQEFYTNCTKVGVWYSGGSNSNKDFTPGVWTHLACTVNYNTGEVNFYKNGVLLATTTNAAKTHYCRGDFYIGDNGVDILMNDFRLYDHCLSKLEVKEIAQGLVLHYKLDGFSSGAKKNYLGNSFPHLPNTVNETVMSQNGGWAYSRSPSSAVSLMTENLEKGYFELVFSANRNNTTSSLIWLTKNWKFSGYERFENDISIWNDIKVNDVLTFSAEIKGSDPYQILAFFNLDGTKYNFIENFSIQENYGSWREIQGSLTITQQIYNLIFSSDLTRFAFTLQVSPILNVTPINKKVPIYVRKLMLEKGNIASSWVPYEGDLGKDTTKIADSSGHGYNLNIKGSPSLNVDNGRHNQSMYFPSGSYLINPISCRECMPTDSLTVNLWVKPTTWTNPISCTEGGGWNFESSPIRFPVYVSSVGYKTAASSTTGASLVGAWHMLTGTFDKTNVKIYIDGELKATTATGSTNVIGYANNGLVIGGEANGSTTSAASSGYVGNISDVRIYATALDADDVLALYKTSAQIDKSKGFHTFAISEGSDKAVRKNGITEIQNISEFDALSYLKYDSNLHIEPDGSVWVHIYHHNHPNLGSFASTDTFATSVKKDENRWFNGTQVCNQLNKWEFLIKYAFTEGGTEYKERWIQTKNPESAVFGDVDAADITRITGEDYKTGTWGGLYKKNSSAYWVMNNGNSGNWFGATGSFSIYQGGIPGYGGGTVTTTGYNDLYVRIDNVLSTVSTNSRITKNGILIGSNFTEK